MLGPEMCIGTIQFWLQNVQQSKVDFSPCKLGCPKYYTLPLSLFWLFFLAFDWLKKSLRSPEFCMAAAFWSRKRNSYNIVIWIITVLILWVAFFTCHNQEYWEFVICAGTWSLFLFFSSLLFCSTPVFLLEQRRCILCSLAQRRRSWPGI